MTHDELRADLSLFALGALAPEEAQEIELHLAEGCDECRREIESWREVVGLLPFGAEIHAPDDLRQELLRRMTSPEAGGASDQRPKGAEVIPLRRRRWWPVGLAAAALLALAFGIGRELDLRGRLQERQETVAQLRSALERASTDVTQGRSELEQVRGELAARGRDAASLRTALTAAQESLALLQAPGLSLVRLKETADAKPATGHMLISPSGKALFYAFDLGPLPAGKVYELWWITEKAGPINAGLFAPDASGLGQVEAAVPTAAGAIKAAAVTIEPDGGVEKPTGPMVLLGNI